MSAEKYRSESQQTLLAVYWALHERPLAGKTLDGLVAELGISRDQAFRTLQNLALDGSAERPGGRGSPWRLTPKAARLSEHYRTDIADYIRTYLGEPR